MVKVTAHRRTARHAQCEHAEQETCFWCGSDVTFDIPYYGIMNSDITIHLHEQSRGAHRSNEGD